MKNISGAAPPPSESEARLALLASIVESSEDAIFSLDLNGIIISWNPAAERIYGYSAEEIIGKSTSLLIPPENTHENADILSNILAGHKIEPYETIRIRKDGSTVPISLTISPVYDENGVVIGRSSIARDISERMQNAAEVLRFKTVLDNTLDMIFIFEQESLRFVYVNQGAVLSMGYSREDLLGMMAYQIKPLLPEPKFRQLIAPLISGEQPSLRFDTVHRRKDGTDFPVSIVLQLMGESEGTKQFVAIVRDITEHKREQKEILDLNANLEVRVQQRTEDLESQQEELNKTMNQLVEATELRNEFVAMVAHDIRSPATTISGFAHLLIDNWDTIKEDKKMDHLKVIIRKTEHLAKFVEDVLHLAQLEANEFTLDIREINICALVRKALFEIAGPETDQKFQFTAPEEVPLVLGDSDRQWEVIMNLLSNAVKYSQAG